ncbi:hypothetical protein GOB57_07875 [Sinorhizobium meliloti]|nr:hypothetical protein [Sinorhizobium meliloti]
MTLATFNDYYEFYAPKVEKYPQRDDFIMPRAETRSFTAWRKAAWPA